ncbi:MAG: hypothetical protein E7290_04020 [Lachnospiraceae bacterium]|nr:hypothetical protein [Lachnospiraceae bacterium]
MLIATSLMYSEDTYEIEKQKKAMQTWKEIGFEVISCNVEEEIIKLKPIFDEVRFVELSRSGKEQTGKPFPFIYDILQMIKCHTDREEELCGIVNSDIFLMNVTRKNIESFFAEAADTVLIMHRYDIDDEKDRKGEYYFSGIDAFFFQRRYIDVFPDMGFMLGRPEWDHWFLYEADKAGMQVIEIKNKVAFHIKHKQRWTAKESTGMVMKKNVAQTAVCFDETFYYKTNLLMSDLARRKVQGVPQSCSADVVKTVQGYYDDVQREQLMKWEKEHYGDAMESMGILYYKGDKPYRVCALHRRVENIGDSTFALGDFFENEKAKGNILRYIEFKDFEFVKKLGRVYIYPAGRAARLLADCLKTYGITVLGMVDKDSTLWGKTYLGNQILDLTVLDNKDSYDNVLIATNLYVREIYEELKQRVEESKLIVL